MQAKSVPGQRLLNRLKKWTKTSREVDDETLKLLFEEIDRDNSGSINFIEFKVLMSKTATGVLSDVELSKAFQDIDGDDSGEIDLEEFLGFYKKWEKRALLPRSSVSRSRASCGING